jgi:hypothetical protein
MANRKRKIEIPRPDFEPFGFNGRENEGSYSAFSKLVPNDNDYCSFDKYGIPIDRDDEETQRHVIVRLRAIYHFFGAEPGWYGILGIYNNDDLCSQLWKPLTRENWIELYRIYEEE